MKYRSKLSVEAKTWVQNKDPESNQTSLQPEDAANKHPQQGHQFRRSNQMEHQRSIQRTNYHSSPQQGSPSFKSARHKDNKYSRTQFNRTIRLSQNSIPAHIMSTKHEETNREIYLAEVLQEDIHLLIHVREQRQLNLKAQTELDEMKVTYSD